MKKEILLIIIFLLIITVISGCINRTSYNSEMEFYKKSDMGTDVIRLTNDSANDDIFYQNPSFFSPDDSKFLFRSQRGDGKYRLYILDLISGDINLLREDTSFGWIPTWSKNSEEVYVGHIGKIITINVENFEARIIDIPSDSWITFLDLSPSGDQLVFVEENTLPWIDHHKILSVINIDGSGYRQVYILDHVNEFYLDHPFFIDENTILFLTRGENRDFTGDFNKPYLINLETGNISRFPICCSHYDVHPDGDKILCASEGYIIDLDGNILKETFGIKGHGVWSSDGETFMMTGDPVPVTNDSPYFGKITIMKLSSNETYNLVSHENTYDSSLEVHIQPNAHFSRDGRFIIYLSDKDGNLDLYMVEVPNL
jgi:Tol biopolymer transport system component